ncbi:MAG TPA: FAD-dependent oxidoreductase [Pseudonocardia sp.]
MTEPSLSPHSTAAVVGAGIAGTTAAYKLRQAGFSVTVFEAAARIGGRVWSVSKGEFLMDLGTAGFLSAYREALYLITEVGLSTELVQRPVMSAMPRGEKLHYFDYTTPAKAALRNRVLAVAGQFKALKLAKAVYKHRDELGYNTYDEVAALDTESVGEYCDRELNEEVLRYVVQPLIRGNWFGGDDTSVALLYWTARNLLAPTVHNLASGVAALPERLATYVHTRLGCPVHNVTDNGGQVDVTYSDSAGGQRTESFDTCVIATTATPALALYPQMDELTRGLYSTARYRGVGTVCLGLSKRPSDRATYITVPPAEDPDVIAVIADHNKAPGRAPIGKGLLTVLLSHDYMQRSEGASDDEMLEFAVSRAARHHGDLTQTLEEFAVVRWSEAMPEVDKGRLRQIVDYRHRVDTRARVQFAGDLDRIPGLNGSLVSGIEAAARVSERFSDRIPEHTV